MILCFTLIENSGRKRAEVAISMAGVIMRGFSVYQGPKNLLVYHPAKRKDNGFQDLVTFSSVEIKNRLHEIIVTEYRKIARNRLVKRIDRDV